MDWWEFFFVLLVVLPVMVLWLGCIIDAIARPDISGWGKAAWTLFILFLPLFGALTYIITRPPIIIAPRTPAMDPAWTADPTAFTTPPSGGNPSSNLSI